MTDEEIAKLPRWLQHVFTVIGIGFTLWLVIGAYRSHVALAEAPRYTIGYITKTGYVVGPNSQSSVSFEYEAQGQRYTTSSSGDVSCTRCLVKFAASDPSIRTFYNRICVPDEVPAPPSEGWETPPFYVQKTLLD